MPGWILTDNEREQWNQVPAKIAPSDLVTHFTLSVAELDLVKQHRGKHNRLGFALQLLTLRYLGFCPEQLATTPVKIVAHVAQQLGVTPNALVAYGDRAQTRTEHFQKIQAYLGFRPAGAKELRALARWLLERALEHDKLKLLLQLSCDHLFVQKIVRPGITVIERLVIKARGRAQQETFRRLKLVLTPQRQEFLDELLVYDDSLGYTPLTWLRRSGKSNSPPVIRNALAKLAFLEQQGVSNWDMSQLNPNRLKSLALLGKRATNQALQRAPVIRRYPILIAFCRQVYEEVTDEVIDLYNCCLAQTYARARRDLDEFRLNAATAINEKLRLLRELGSIVLDIEVVDEQVRECIYQRVSPQKLQAAIEECTRLIRPANDTYFDFLGSRYGYIRQFAADFLAAFTFHSHIQPNPLLNAVALLRKLNAEGKRKLPKNTSFDFVPSKWRAYVVNDSNQIVRRYYELCVLWELRSALRSGNVWLKHSRKYANPESYLIPQQQWITLRSEVCQLLQVPEAGELRLQQINTQLEAQLSRLDKAIIGSKLIRIEAGELIVSPLKASELPQSSKALQQLLTKRLPQVDLTDLFIEVDGWTGFSRYLTHIDGTTEQTQESRIYLYAAILAQACNLGLTRMAQIADLSHDRLLWYTNWYLQENTLRAAVNAIVNFQYHQPLSQYWGGGTLSSSDGQRFPVSVKNVKAVALPRYFGYGRGLTFYTWTSDQLSQYGTKVIPTTVRDATYVLDEILANETELPIVEHTTDTAGYTELVFALFDLLGLQFSPRIRDLGEQRLYRLNREQNYQHLEPLLKGKINPERILSRWDDMLRVAGSLKRGWVTASLLISKLQSFPQQNALTCSLQEYGRLIKTMFILRYIESEEYRRRINTQLNKGETLHSLRRFLFFAHQGQIRASHDEDLVNQATCLNLVTNAVVAWNTVYMTAAIDQLKTENYLVDETDITHLSPARYEHINPYGKYQFDLAKNLNRQLRPLR